MATRHSRSHQPADRWRGRCRLKRGAPHYREAMANPPRCSTTWACALIRSSTARAALVAVEPVSCEEAVHVPMMVVAVIALRPAAAMAGADEATLVDAVKHLDRPAVSAMLARHVDVNAAEGDGTTALHWAARGSDPAMVSLLVSAGANVSAANRYGVKPLSLACEAGNAAIVDLLLRGGADPNTTSTEGETALMTAARSGSVESVDLLIAWSRRQCEGNMAP